MNELICTLIAIGAVVIFGAAACVVLKYGPSVRKYIKSFIRWNKNRIK